MGTDNAIFKEFLLESFENLSNISDELTEYEKDPQNKEIINSIFRKVHTLKGSASFLGLTKLQEITHSTETIMDLLRDGTISLNPEMVDVFLECFDSCVEILKSLETNEKESERDFSGLLKKLTTILEKSLDSYKSLKSDSHKIPESEDVLNEVQGEKKNIETAKKAIVQNGIGESSKTSVSSQPKESKLAKRLEQMNKAIVSDIKSETISSSPEAKPAPAASPAVAVSAAPQVAAAPDAGGEHVGGDSKGAIADSVVRVNVQLLDKIMNIVGELVLNRNQILQYANGVDSPDLNRLVQQLNVITTELQTDIMTTRMQPVGSVLSKFERIVRDLARSQGKKLN